MDVDAIGVAMGHMGIVGRQYTHLECHGHVMDQIPITVHTWIVTPVRCCGWKRHVDVMSMHPEILPGSL